MNLWSYDLVVINSSAGKDSLVSIFAVCKLAQKQGYPISKIVVSHQDLGAVEWVGTKELAEKQAGLFGLKIFFSKRRNKDGYEETFLEYVKRRGKWPSNKQRWCTSDFKRAPGGRVVRALAPNKSCKVLHVFGFRKDESPARSKRRKLSINKELTTKSRLVHDWLPIHDWSLERVWNVIKTHNLPYHPAYDLGMPRLSCVFCIFSPFNALVIAGKENPKLLDEYIEAEEFTGHKFRADLSLKEIKVAIENDYMPTEVKNWIM